MASAGSEAFDEFRDRKGGVERPTRSNAKSTNVDRSRSRGSRKANSSNGIHQRRNKRVSW
ncbi:hypothetical protein Pla123a_24780 [Posidoniimonas polymericola]|uniref:Uncharacterized protein n=1 Tax=Posidoniimonas polymericola TaxID=2528002 RepID=A0A5C5YQD1_9BACT|nr:hypothetical protein [Posidoniimonas polymericola]TWT77049.1 hypothetical protein Pla123a_24780 [Posidoniimonas polymericola]